MVSNYFASCYRSIDNMAPTPMDFFDLANLLDNDGNLQNEMMVRADLFSKLACFRGYVEIVHLSR